MLIINTIIGAVLSMFAFFVTAILAIGAILASCLAVILISAEYSSIVIEHLVNAIMQLKHVGENSVTIIVIKSFFQ